MDLFGIGLIIFGVSFLAHSAVGLLKPEKLWKRDYLAERKRADGLEQQVRELQHELEKMKEATR